MNMNKALQNLFHAVSGETTKKVNISKLLVDIHTAITGVEPPIKNNWARIINSMAENWSGGGGGDGYTANDIAMRTISGAISGSATSIESYAFYSCHALTAASFPSATSIGNSAFGYCSALTAADFPSATSIGSSAFFACYALTTISFPNVTSIQSSAFGYCSALTAASFPKATFIGSSAFGYCSKLTKAYFLASSVASLKSGAFVNTPMLNSSYTGSFGSIYVPASLVDAYKSAPNWSRLSSCITSYAE